MVACSPVRLFASFRVRTIFGDRVLVDVPVGGNDHARRLTSNLHEIALHGQIGARPMTADDIDEVVLRKVRWVPA